MPEHRDKIMSEYKFKPRDRVEVTQLVHADRRSGLRIGMVGEVVRPWGTDPNRYLVAFDGFEPLTDSHVREDGYLVTEEQMRLAYTKWAETPPAQETDPIIAAATELAKAKVERAKAWAAKLAAGEAHEKAVARERDAQCALEHAVTQAARAR